MSTSATFPGTFGAGQSFWQRAWKLQITPQSAPQITVTNSAWGNEPLKMTFEVQSGVRGPNPAFILATINIWNLNSAATQALLDSPGSKTGNLNIGYAPGDHQGKFNVVIQQGDRVTLSAGYQSNFNAQTGLIFQGYVYQPMWEKENVTDYKLTLLCVLGLYEDTQNIVALSLAAGASQLQIVRQMAQNARIPIPIDAIDEAALSKTLPRGKVIFGRPGQKIAEIAADNNLQCWFSPNGLNIRRLDGSSGVGGSVNLISVGSGGSNYLVGDVLNVVQNGGSGATLSVTAINSAGAVTGLQALLGGNGYQPANGLATTGGHGVGATVNVLPVPVTPAYTYSPPPSTGKQVLQQTPGGLSQTLIGTPQQTQEGVVFRVLLDARPQIGDIVQLNYSVIRQLARSYGPKAPLPSRLEADGNYIIAGIKHVGDTRGNDWYTEFNCITAGWTDLFTRQ